MASFNIAHNFNKVRFRASNGQYAKTNQVLFKRAVASAARKGKAVAQAEAPKSTGRLARNIKSSTSGSKAVISTRTPYAMAIEYGDGPRKIGPAFMRFYWKNQGRMFTGPPSKKWPDGNWYAKYNWPAVVTRPPIKSRPFLRPGVEAMEAELVRYLKKHL